MDGLLACRSNNGDGLVDNGTTGKNRVKLVHARETLCTKKIQLVFHILHEK